MSARAGLAVLLTTPILPMEVSGEALSLVGVALSTFATIFLATRKNSSDNRTASAAEVKSLGERLDAQFERMTEQDGRIDELRAANTDLQGQVARQQRVIETQQDELRSQAEQLSATRRQLALTTNRTAAQDQELARVTADLSTTRRDLSRWQDYAYRLKQILHGQGLEAPDPPEPEGPIPGPAEDAAAVDETTRGGEGGAA